MVKLYLKLFHGRKTLNEDMDDWGVEGPHFECDFGHCTYASDIKFGDDGVFKLLQIVDGCVYYDGMYYGDFSFYVCDEDSADSALVAFDPEKAKLPGDLASMFSSDKKIPTGGPYVIQSYVNGVLMYWTGTGVPSRRDAFDMLSWSAKTDDAVQFSDEKSALTILYKLLNGIGAVRPAFDCIDAEQGVKVQGNIVTDGDDTKIVNASITKGPPSVNVKTYVRNKKYRQETVQCKGVTAFENCEFDACSFAGLDGQTTTFPGCSFQNCHLFSSYAFLIGTQSAGYQLMWRLL